MAFMMVRFINLRRSYSSDVINTYVKSSEGAADMIEDMR